MTPRQRKGINTVGGTVPPPAIDQPHITEDTDSFSPQGAATCVQLPQQHKNQLLQMLAIMKEQKKNNKPNLIVPGASGSRPRECHL